MGSPRNSFMRLEAFEPWKRPNEGSRQCRRLSVALSFSLGVLVGPMLSPGIPGLGIGMISCQFVGWGLFHHVCMCTGFLELWAVHVSRCQMEKTAGNLGDEWHGDFSSWRGVSLCSQPGNYQSTITPT